MAKTGCLQMKTSSMDRYPLDHQKWMSNFNLIEPKTNSLGEYNVGPLQHIFTPIRPKKSSLVSGNCVVENFFITHQPA